MSQGEGLTVVPGDERWQVLPFTVPYPPGGRLGITLQDDDDETMACVGHRVKIAAFVLDHCYAAGLRVDDRVHRLDGVTLFDLKWNDVRSPPPDPAPPRRRRHVCRRRRRRHHRRGPPASRRASEKASRLLAGPCGGAAPLSAPRPRPRSKRATPAALPPASGPLHEAPSVGPAATRTATSDWPPPAAAPHTRPAIPTQ